MASASGSLLRPTPALGLRCNLQFDRRFPAFSTEVSVLLDALEVRCPDMARNLSIAVGKMFHLTKKRRVGVINTINKALNPYLVVQSFSIDILWVLCKRARLYLAFLVLQCRTSCHGSPIAWASIWNVHRLDKGMNHRLLCFRGSCLVRGPVVLVHGFRVCCMCSSWPLAVVIQNSLSVSDRFKKAGSIQSIRCKGLMAFFVVFLGEIHQLFIQILWYHGAWGENSLHCLRPSWCLST